MHVALPVSTNPYLDDLDALNVNGKLSMDSTGELAESRLPGIYVLVFLLKEDTVTTVGKLGILEFPSGYYAYVGSGRKGAVARVRRHLRPHPRASWHLDYILPKGQPLAAIIGHTTDALECPLAQSLGLTFQVFPRFGSSDCRCAGHLFRSDEIGQLARAATDRKSGFGCATTVPRLSASSNF